MKGRCVCGVPVGRLGAFLMTPSEVVLRNTPFAPACLPCARDWAKSMSQPCAVWVCAAWLFSREGYDVGQPEGVYWFAAGKPATRAQAVDGLQRCVPILAQKAKARGPVDLSVLAELTRAATATLPPRPGRGRPRKATA